MRVAGIHAAGRMIWVDAGESVVEPLDRAQIRVGDALLEGEVLVTTEQLAGDPPVAEGVLVRAYARAAGADPCVDIPGAGMPPLGSRIGGRLVVGIDAVQRTVSAEGADGVQEVQPVSPSTRLGSPEL
jgi:hypothetical protein